MGNGDNNKTEIFDFKSKGICSRYTGIRTDDDS